MKKSEVIDKISYLKERLRNLKNFSDSSIEIMFIEDRELRPAYELLGKLTFEELEEEGL